MSGATVPRIVLPITSRGLAVTDRLCWGFLGAAMVVAAVLILYLNRGTTFSVDEVNWVYASPDLSLKTVFTPLNGHLVATSQLTYNAMLETFGADDHLPFRLLGVVAVLLSTALFYALVKRWIGGLPALAPALVLLFFGGGWQHVLVSSGFTVVFSVATGLAALLALERGDRRGDLLGCALVALSIATYTIGLAFLVGIAISVLLRRDRWRRAWIFLIPLALYAVWWLWALPNASSSQEHTTVSNVLLIPNYAADSLAAVMGALTGLGYNFADPASFARELGWGPVLAALAVSALAVRIRRGGLPASLWIALGIVLTYWALGALATGTGTVRVPSGLRYMYPGAVGVLLVAAAAAAGIPISRLGLAALFAAAAVSLATNVALMRDGGAFFRDTYSSPARAQFAMLDLARGRVGPDFDPAAAVPESSAVSAPARTYFAVVDRYGSPGFSIAELEDQSEQTREGADRVLASALELHLRPSRDPASGGCRELRGREPGGGVSFALPPGGAALRTQAAAPSAVTVRRFADSPDAEVGSLLPERTAMLEIPPDASAEPWRASVAGAAAVTLCPLR